jgi:hypothetical protein
VVRVRVRVSRSFQLFIFLHSLIKRLSETSYKTFPKKLHFPSCGISFLWHIFKQVVLNRCCCFLFFVVVLPNSTKKIQCTSMFSTDRQTDRGKES